jgi:DNA invertase Pin-like site-specific DNA recombinase
MKVIGYGRVSSDQQIDGTSLDTQERIAKGLALTHDLPEPSIIQDKGVSGTIPLLKRPSGAVFDNLSKGDVVIVATIDRLFRSSLDGQKTIDVWKRNGVRLIVNGLGELTADDNAIGKLMFDMMVSFANYERELIRERVLKGQRAKKASGGFCGGKAPWGYRQEGVEKESKVVAESWRASAVTEIVQLKSLGFGLRTIADSINDNSRGWSKISKSTVATILQEAA